MKRYIQVPKYDYAFDSHSCDLWDGKDIEIRLRVHGIQAELARYQELIIPVEILNTVQTLDEQGVRDAVGNKVYSVTTSVYKDNVLQKSTSGTATQSSDVEIE